jgi:hypothetical protein
MLHSGGRLVTLDELQCCKTPAPEGRWHPVSHVRVLNTVKETLHGAGYQVKAEKYALARSDARFFGVLDLTTPLAQGVALSVGVRNSVDKSFPLGFAAGSRVFVCDNLAFRSELLVRRKHTVNGMKAFGMAIGAAVASLTSFRDTEAVRIQRMAEMHLNPARMKPLSMLPFGFMPGTDEFKALVRDTIDPAVSYHFRQLEKLNPRGLRAEVGSAARLVNAVFRSPAFLVRCVGGFDHGAFLSLPRARLVIERGDEIDDDAMRTILGGVNVLVTDWCERPGHRLVREPAPALSPGQGQARRVYQRPDRREV